MTTHKPGCAFYSARLTCDCGKHDYDRGAREAVALYRKELAAELDRLEAAGDWSGDYMAGWQSGIGAIRQWLIEADVESAAPEGEK